MFEKFWLVPLGYLISFALIVLWHNVLKRLEAGAGDPSLPMVPYKKPFKEEPLLHRLLTWMCGALFVGLMLEGAFGLFGALARYGVVLP